MSEIIIRKAKANEPNVQEAEELVEPPLTTIYCPVQAPRPLIRMQYRWADDERTVDYLNSFKVNGKPIPSVSEAIQREKALSSRFFSGFYYSASDESRTSDFNTPAVQGAASTSPVGVNSLKLYDGLEKYIQSKTSKRNLKWKPRTEKENKAIFALLIEIIGNKPINLITPDDIELFVSTLERLPSNRNTNPLLKNKSIDQILRIPGLEPMSVGTIVKYISRICSAFEFLRKRGYSSINPAAEFNTTDHRDDDEKRNPLSSKLLTLLFSGSWFNAHKRDVREDFSPSRLFVTLMTLFTGVRQSEICQADIRDLDYVDGLFCLILRRAGDHSFKNEYARRVIPLHPFLIQAGLKNYLQWVKENQGMFTFGKDKLWPDLYSESEKTPGRKFSDDFKKYREKLRGFVKLKDTFHSLRHNFIDCLKQQLVDPYVIQSLVGHSTGRVSHDTYGKRLNLQTQYEHGILKLKFDVNLDHLLDPKNNPFVEGVPSNIRKGTYRFRF